MLKHIPISDISFTKYEEFLTYLEAEEIQELAENLRGKKIVHVNATDTGGGVAEILRSLVPLERAVGLNSSWMVIPGTLPFFSITKKIHNILQGSTHSLGKSGLTQEEKDFYLDVNKDMMHLISAIETDICIIHDPQPLVAGALADLPHKILRIHIDLSSPDINLVDFFLPYIKKYKRTIFSLEDYVPRGLEEESIVIIPPAIDPLAPKNRRISKEKAWKELTRFGVDTNRPLIAQVSRFDPWKDSVGVIHAYMQAKEVIPGLQLILLGNFAKDDPEGGLIVKELQTYTNVDKDIFLITENNDMLVNSVQTVADVVLQKSIREGFGLTVTEAMWKGKPVVAGNVGGLRLQIQNGENGFLVNSSEEAAVRMLELLGDTELQKRLGIAAHETVREKFLLPDHLRSHLLLYADILGV